MSQVDAPKKEFNVFINEGTDVMPRLKKVGTAHSNDESGININLDMNRSDTELILLPVLPMEEEN